MEFSCVYVMFDDNICSREFQKNVFNSLNGMVFIFVLQQIKTINKVSHILLFGQILEARAEICKKNHWFLE